MISLAIFRWGRFSCVIPAKAGIWGSASDTRSWGRLRYDKGDVRGSRGFVCVRGRDSRLRGNDVMVVGVT